MANSEHVEIVKRGVEAIEKWRSKNRKNRLNLDGANLRGANLRGANLRGAKLSDTNLYDANLDTAILFGAVLRDTNLSLAHLHKANLSYADLRGASLSCADLRNTNLHGAELDKADLAESSLFRTNFVDVDLSATNGLSAVNHAGPSYIDMTTLTRCGWKLPEVFLRGCGLAPWEILSAKLYDPSLTPVSVEKLQYEIFSARTTGFKVGAMFVSYSRKDIAIVERLSSRLFDEGLHAWVDVHDATSGPLQEMIHIQIDRSDVVLLILSKNSINSDWVEHEVKRAHRREKEGKRNILCPIALDDSWKSKMDDKDWEHLEKKNILDFSEWEDDERFDAQFRKMLDGMKLYYGPKGE